MKNSLRPHHCCLVDISGGKVASDSFTDKSFIMLNKGMTNKLCLTKRRMIKTLKKQLLISLVYNYTKLKKDIVNRFDMVLDNGVASNLERFSRLIFSTANLSSL